MKTERDQDVSVFFQTDERFFFTIEKIYDIVILLWHWTPSVLMNQIRFLSLIFSVFYHADPIK